MDLVPAQGTAGFIGGKTEAAAIKSHASRPHESSYCHTPSDSTQPRRAGFFLPCRWRAPE